MHSYMLYWVPPGSSPSPFLLIVLTPGTSTTRGQWGSLVPSEEVVKVQHITYDAQEKGGQWGLRYQQKGLVCAWPTPWPGLLPAHRVFYFYAMSRVLNVQSEQSYTAWEGNPRHAGLSSPTPGISLCLLCEVLRNTGGRHRAGPSHQGHATRRCQMTSEHTGKKLYPLGTGMSCRPPT